MIIMFKKHQGNITIDLIKALMKQHGKENVVIKTDMHLKEKFFFLTYSSNKTKKIYSTYSELYDKIYLKSLNDYFSNKLITKDNFIKDINENKIALYIKKTK